MDGTGWNQCCSGGPLLPPITKKNREGLWWNSSSKGSKKKADNFFLIGCNSSSLYLPWDSLFPLEMISRWTADIFGGRWNPNKVKKQMLLWIWIGRSSKEEGNHEPNEQGKRQQQAFYRWLKTGFYQKPPLVIRIVGDDPSGAKCIILALPVSTYL